MEEDMKLEIKGLARIAGEEENWGSKKEWILIIQGELKKRGLEPLNMIGKRSSFPRASEYKFTFDLADGRTGIAEVYYLGKRIDLKIISSENIILPENIFANN
jgi:hypothetical protein